MSAPDEATFVVVTDHNGPTAVIHVPTIVTAAAPGPQGLPGHDGAPGAQGPPGDPGDAPGQIRFTGPAATALSGHRIVTPNTDGALNYASNDDLAFLTAPLWLTTQAANTGDPVNVVMYGSFTEPTWSWTPGPLYLAVDGLLTQTPPTTASGALFLATVGYATSATTAFIDAAPPILLT